MHVFNYSISDFSRLPKEKMYRRVIFVRRGRLPCHEPLDFLRYCGRPSLPKINTNTNIVDMI